MLSDSMQGSLNDQLREELFSAYQYLAMAAYCEDLGLSGFGRWLRVQAQEELGHALRIYDFVLDRGARVMLQAIDAPVADFPSAQEVFAQALAQEQHISGLINHLYAEAVHERDYASQVFMHWFIEEQVEEEKTAAQIVAKLRMVGDDQPALLMLDRELGQRGGSGTPE